MDTSDTTVFRRRGNSCYKPIAVIAVIAGVYASIVSVLRFGRFLGAFNTALKSDNDLLPSSSRIYFRIVVNWSLASSYLYLPSIVGVVIERIGNLCGLPDCYFKFTKIVLLSSILNGVIGFWQEVPEICLWNLSTLYHAEIIHFYLHCSMWIISFMIMLAIDITEITGIKPHDHVSIVNITYCADNNFTYSRLVWPEQLPYGDRIKEQINYVPKDYRYSKTPYKQILIQTGIGHIWEILKPDQGEFFGCPVSQCWLTYNKSLGPDVDAVLFRHSYSRPEYRRPPNQIWILLYTECPVHHSYTPVSDVSVFNWTANYRWDSDVPFPYGYFVENNSPLPRACEKNYALNKTKKVAWFVSNCNPYNKRMIYANELAKHISVDVYGGCGKLQCPKSKEAECFQMLKKDYKFYLSFESSHCIYYVTEKFFINALSNDVVPIVMGPKRSYYELIAPNNSFIHVDDFGSPKELADYLHLLDGNHQLYNKYFQWKGSGTIIEDTRLYCRLCAMLHDTNRAPRHYEDINKWWKGPGKC
ncbi:unnamed protein product [Macrosiphum euphorbiae]|uniref:Fucosyltransferase n=1 Tax=Macrosiphum euphorbiae TaxID=13131 RepID=A0AAV0WZ03_9HEMI|nr:unnamed protein product [Macrosiphum euphorbiae]